MSDMTPEAAALLQRARELLEPEPEQIAAVRGALARKLEAGAAPSCGEPESLALPRLASRGPWGLGGKLGLAAGLTLLTGAGVLVLRVTPHADVRAAAAPGPGTAANVAVSETEPATPSMAQPEAEAPEATEAAAQRRRPTTSETVDAQAASVPHASAGRRSSARPATTPTPALPRSAPQMGEGDPLARAAGVRGTRRAPTAQPARATDPTLARTEPSAADEERLPGVLDQASGEEEHRPGTAVPERDLLVREVAMLEGARTALERGDDARALQILDAHAREFPAGALSEEQLALRARALCALGRIDEGRRAVQRLAARAPESPHLKRSQAACGIAE